MPGLRSRAQNGLPKEKAEGAREGIPREPSPAPVAPGRRGAAALGRLADKNDRAPSLRSLCPLHISTGSSLGF